MPQVRGKTSFLTNLRRQTTAFERRIGIDNSNAYIENEAIEEHKRKELDQIHLQRYRTLVDRIYELNETKKDCFNYERMKSIAMEKHIDAIMDERRKCKEEAFERITSGKAAASRPIQAPGRADPVVTARPKTVGGLRPSKNGFSHIQIDDSDSDDDVYYRGRPMKAGPPPVVAVSPKTTAYPSRSRRRPKTSHPVRSLRQIRQALEEEFSGAPKKRTRPKTTLGFSVWEETPDAQESPPGRSFNELKDLAHIDHLNSAHVRARQEEIRKRRNQRLAEEQRILQRRLEQFYERLDRFKRDSNRNLLKATALLQK